MLLFSIYTILLFLLLKKLNFFNTTAFGGLGMYISFVVKLGVALYFFAFPYTTMIDSAHYMNDAEVLSRVIYKNPSDFFQIFFGFGDVQSLNEQYLSSTTYWSHDKGWMFSDTRNVIRVNAIFHWMAFNNPRVVLLFNILICLLGLRWIYEGLTQNTASRKNWLFVLIFFLPSTLLWTANLSKEAFLLFGLGLVMRNILTGRHIHFSTLIGLLILFLFKPYVGAAFLFSWVVYILMMQQNKVWRIASLALFALSIGLAAYFTQSRITQSISQKQFDFINLAEGGIWLEFNGSAVRIEDQDTIHIQITEADNRNFYAVISEPIQVEKRIHGSKSEAINIAPSKHEFYVLHQLHQSGSYIPLKVIDGKCSNLVKTIPNALFNTLFRPLPNDPPKSLSKWYFVLESYLLLALTMFALTKIRGTNHVKVIIFLGVACLLIALIIGWITPVLGAIIRYKLPITLSLIAASYLLLFPQKKQQKFT